MNAMRASAKSKRQNKFMTQPCSIESSLVPMARPRRRKIKIHFVLSTPQPISLRHSGKKKLSARGKPPVFAWLRHASIDFMADIVVAAATLPARLLS
jgi:hypothetical protein